MILIFTFVKKVFNHELLQSLNILRFLQIFVAVFLGRFTNIVLGERFPCQLINIFIDICYNAEKKFSSDTGIHTFIEKFVL